jgi:hypothetical protein
VTVEPGLTEADIKRELLSRLGIPEGSSVSIELMEGCDSSLVFIRLLPKMGLFAFGSTDTLLDCARCCGGHMESSLFYIDGVYILYVSGYELPMALFEYGEALCEEPLYITHLTEQGRCLIAAHALERLSPGF